MALFSLLTQSSSELQLWNYWHLSIYNCMGKIRISLIRNVTSESFIFASVQNHEEAKQMSVYK